MGWAPLGRMQAAGLLRAAAFLLTTVDFRQPACDILTIAAARKQAQVQPHNSARLVCGHSSSACRAAQPASAGSHATTGMLDECRPVHGEQDTAIAARLHRQ